MKITNKAALLLLSGFTVFPQANAYDGQITFEGSVSDVTCIITGGEDGGTESTSGTFTITLPQTRTSKLTKLDDVDGLTGFYLKLSGAQCTDGKVASVLFEKASSDINANGNLNNTLSEGVGGATNVQVQLLNKDKKTVLNLNNVSSDHQNVTIAGNSARFDYAAQYYAIGQSKPGYVKAIVAYTINYN